MGHIVNPIAAVRPRRFRQESHLLVVTDGFEIAARPSSEFSPLHAPHNSLITHWKVPLEPVATTDRMVGLAVHFGNEREWICRFHLLEQQGQLPLWAKRTPVRVARRRDNGWSPAAAFSARLQRHPAALC